MRIKVLFFAQIKDAFGESERWMEVPEGCSVGNVAKQLLRGNFIPTLFAVNEQFETVEKILKENDHLAIMTPVSGG
jgi:molybdopterin converting factor small subunit